MVRYRWFLALFLGFSVQALAAETLPELKVGVMDFPLFMRWCPTVRCAVCCWRPSIS